MRPAGVRYTKRFIAMMSSYMAALFAVTWIFRHHHVRGVAAYLLALLPALPIVGVVIVVGLYMREETDEVGKAMLTQAMLWGIGLTLSVATLWGFLRKLRAGEPRGQLYGVSGVLPLHRGGSVRDPPELPVKNRLRVLRAERNWSQADLAERLDVSRQSVNAIETGKFDPSLPLAFRLGRLFSLPIEQIFSDEQ